MPTLPIPRKSTRSSIQTIPLRELIFPVIFNPSFGLRLRTSNPGKRAYGDGNGAVRKSVNEFLHKPSIQIISLSALVCPKFQIGVLGGGCEHPTLGNRRPWVGDGILRKSVGEFLQAFHSNFSSIFARFRDIAVEVFTTLRYINVHLLTYLLTYYCRDVLGEQKYRILSSGSGYRNGSQ